MAECHSHLRLLLLREDGILHMLTGSLERVALAILRIQRHGHVVRRQRGGVRPLGPDDEEVVLPVVAQDGLRRRAQEVPFLAAPDPLGLPTRLLAGGEAVFRLDIGDHRREVGARTAPDIDLHLEGGVVDGFAVIGDAADTEVEGEAAVAVAAKDAPFAAAVRVDEDIVAGVEGEVVLMKRVLQGAILPFPAQRVGPQDHLLGHIAIARKQRHDRAAAVDQAVIHVRPAQRQRSGAGVEDRRLLHLKECAVLVVDRIVLALARLGIGIADGLVARTLRRDEIAAQLDALDLSAL